MRELLAEVHHRAWTVTGVAGALAAACAFLGMGLPAALTAMAAGAILMWVSEEESRLVAAMAPAAAATGTAAPVALALPGPAPVLARDPVVWPKEWRGPVPAPRPPVRRQRPEGRPAHRRQRRRVVAATPSD